MIYCRQRSKKHAGAPTMRSLGFKGWWPSGTCLRNNQYSLKIYFSTYIFCLPITCELKQWANATQMSEETSKMSSLPGKFQYWHYSYISIYWLVISLYYFIIVVAFSEAESPAKSHKQGTAAKVTDQTAKLKIMICCFVVFTAFCVEVKRRQTQQSPFKVPDSKHIFLQSINDKRDQKEVRCVCRDHFSQLYAFVPQVFAKSQELIFAVSKSCCCSPS